MPKELEIELEENLDIDSKDMQQKLNQVIGLCSQLVDLKINNIDQFINVHQEILTAFQNCFDNMENRIKFWLTKIDSVVTDPSLRVQKDEAQALELIIKRKNAWMNLRLLASKKRLFYLLSDRKKDRE